MKNKLKSWLSGMLVGVLLVTGTTVFAAGGIDKTIDVVFNNVNLNFDSDEVSSVGESYTLSNGSKVPFSILYEGTTYLPIRKVAELFDKEVGWDGTTSTVSLYDDVTSSSNYKLSSDQINEMDVYKVDGDEYIMIRDLMMSVVEQTDLYELNALLVKGIDPEEETFSIGKTMIYKNLDIIKIDGQDAVSASNYDILIDYLEDNLNDDLQEIDFGIRVGDNYYRRPSDSGSAFVSEDNELFITADEDSDYINLLYLLDIIYGNYDIDDDSLGYLDGEIDVDYADLYIRNPDFMNDSYDASDIGYSIDVVYDTSGSDPEELSRSLVIYNEDENVTYKVDKDGDSNVSSVPYFVEIIVDSQGYTVINVSAILDYLEHDYEFEYDSDEKYYVFDATDGSDGLILVGSDPVGTDDDDDDASDDFDDFETEIMVFDNDYYEIDIDWERFYYEDDDLYYLLETDDDDFDDLEDFNALLSKELDTESYDGSNDEIEKTIVIDVDESYDYDSKSGGGGYHKFYNEDGDVVVKIEVDDDGYYDDISNDDLIKEIDGKDYLDMDEWVDFMDQELDIYYDDDSDIESMVVEIDYN